MIRKIDFWNIISWSFGIIALKIGVVNIFWGNDTIFGIFIFLLAFLYFSPLTALIHRSIGVSIHYGIKIFLALFILWATFGVGELIAKIDLMLNDFTRLL